MITVSVMYCWVDESQMYCLVMADRVMSGSDCVNQMCGHSCNLIH